MTRSVAVAAFQSLEPAVGGTETYRVVWIGSIAARAVYVAKARDGTPAFLVVGQTQAHRAPVRLRYVEIVFGAKCELHLGGASEAVIATVISCRAHDSDVQEYFVELVELILTTESAAGSSDAGGRIELVASLFQKLTTPRSREAQGLFGELVVIGQSPDVPAMLRGWHADPTEHFDFAWMGDRLEVKTSARRVRKHRFSQAQCQPPGAGVLASLFVERSTGGRSISDLMDEIGQRAAGYPDLVLKMQISVRSSLGADAVQELAQGYDFELAVGSLEFFDLREIPAIRGPLPKDVSELSFSSNVDACPRLPSAQAWRLFADLV